MSTNSKGNSLSAIIPIANYSLHKQNIRSFLIDLAKYEIEVILVLDSETSESLSDIETLVAKLKLSGKVFQTKAGNPGESRNTGKRNASRDWIVFWDCDDQPIIKTCIDMVTKAELEGAQVAIGSYQKEDKKTHTVTNYEIGKNHLGINIGLNPGIWRMVFHRKFIQNIDYPSLSMGEDQVFLGRVLNSNPIISYLNEYAYVYGTGIQNQLTANLLRKREIIGSYQLLLKERKYSHRYVKIISTMLMRQEITILRLPKLGIYQKLRTIATLTLRALSNLDILMLFVKYKILEAQKKRSSS